MQREYQSGTDNNATFFTGVEIEHTPAYGKKTLFVVGLQARDKIVNLAMKSDCDHIYLGANHSFNNTDYDTLIEYESLCKDLLYSGFYVTLDFDVKYYNDILDLLCCLCEHNRFIAQISVKLPYLSNLNYNACVKIDDKDFNATNPGIWVHQIHDLMDRKLFTPWSEYGKDEILN